MTRMTRHASGKVARGKTTPDEASVTSTEARRLFADWADVPALVLAVSGGPDSTALMFLAAKWRSSLKRGPRLLVVTVDHGLRKEAAAEAKAVASVARALKLEHAILRWRGPKPSTGLPAAAREARYRLLASAAQKAGAKHILTGHTSDDQAETLLMRMSRGSGLAGLGAMQRQAVRGDVVIGRPFLGIAKARLVATLLKAKIGSADDPTNRDLSFTRPRFRQLMPLMAREGLDSRNLGRLAQRLSRANAALEAVVGVMERAIGRVGAGDTIEIDARAFATLPDEIALRLLGRAVSAVGHEGPVELAKLESLLAAVQAPLRADRAGGRVKLTLAGALVACANDCITVEAAPPRRSKRS